MKKIRKYRVMSVEPGKLEGLEALTEEEAREIRQYTGVELTRNGVFINLNPVPTEGEAILKRHPNSTKFQGILAKYGFISPAIIEIEAYVDYMMIRYGEEHSELDVQQGMWAEKAFDLLLQNVGIPICYREPIRDWRSIQAVDFYVPLLGLVEAKSWTDYHEGKINVPYERFVREHPDYVVGIRKLVGPYVTVVGAMSYEKVAAYSDTKYYKTGSPDFLTIPAEDFANAIKPRKLYETLVQIKKTIEDIGKIKLGSEEDGQT